MSATPNAVFIHWLFAFSLKVFDIELMLSIAGKVPKPNADITKAPPHIVPADDAEINMVYISPQGSSPQIIPRGITLEDVRY